MLLDLFYKYINLSNKTMEGKRNQFRRRTVTNKGSIANQISNLTNIPSTFSFTAN